MKSLGVQNKKCILIVDDDFINREIMKNIFSDKYEFEEAENGLEGLQKIEDHGEKFCAIISDVSMPEMDGIELLHVLKQLDVTAKIPVFIITVHDEESIIEEAFELGVMDVINKPVVPFITKRRVQSVIELFQSREALGDIIVGQEKQISENEDTIKDLNRGMIEALATAIEFRDVESGEHVSRIHDITKYMLANTPLGEGFTREEIEEIATASIMHDVGKIAIPDSILNKPGRLDKEEFEIMKQHSARGAELLERIPQLRNLRNYQYAYEIAKYHHERWDGRGYPDGLKGDEIPISAQIVSIADVYDALVSKRVYKGAYASDEAVGMIQRGECGVFNPTLLESFVEAEKEIRKWYAAKIENDEFKP